MPLCAMTNHAVFCVLTKNKLLVGFLTDSSPQIAKALR